MTIKRLVRYTYTAASIITIGAAGWAAERGLSNAGPARASAQHQAVNSSLAKAGIHIALMPYTGTVGAGRRAITSQEAVAASAQYSHVVGAAGTVQVTLQYGSFSDDVLRSSPQGGVATLLFQRVPAWIVTYSGTGVRWPTGRSSSEPAPTVVEVSNVAINAATGEFMEAYSIS